MEGMGEINLWSGGNVSEGGSTYTKAKFREGGCLIAGEEQEFSWLNGKHGLITGREAVIASRRVSFTGEQFLCGRGAVSYQRAEEAEREKNSILSDKVATFPVYFKFVPNRRGGELHF
jgi:hypothetical protein